MFSTEKALRESNPWQSVALDCLYSDNEHQYALDADRDMLEVFNRKLAITDRNRLVLNVPPEPWQGNPLRAKVIFLSLNPGYVDRVNRKLAYLLQTDRDVLRRILQFKQDTICLRARSFFPASNCECPVGAHDAVSILGDWYWEDAFATLRRAVCGDSYPEPRFYEDVAIMQFHAYSSEKFQRTFPPSGQWLASQEYTRNLIEYISRARPGVLFVLMRARDKWEKLLSRDGLWGRLNKVIKENRSMSQAISPDNLRGADGRDQFAVICRALNPCLQVQHRT